MINLEIPDRSTIGLAHPLILLRTSWQKFAAVPNKLPSCLELQIEQRTRQTEAARKSRAGVPAWENSLRTHGDSMAFKTFKKINNIDRAAAAHPCRRLRR
jgi:hypothetical protein